MVRYWIKYGRWYRWPSYLFSRIRWYLKEPFVYKYGVCCCIEGSNDFYWNGYWKFGKDCECGG